MDRVSKSAQSMANVIKLEYSKIFDQGLSGFNLVKVTLLFFYTLGIIGSITFGSIALSSPQGYYWQGVQYLIAATVFGMIYQIILSVVGIIGTLKERKNVMVVWTAMNVLSIVSNGVLFSWVSSLLVSFTTVLTAIFAYMIHIKDKQALLNGQETKDLSQIKF